MTSPKDFMNDSSNVFKMIAFGIGGIVIVFGGYLFGQFGMARLMNVGGSSDITETETLLIEQENDEESVVRKEPVYVILESHNEDSWGPKVNRPEAYRAYRENLVERLDLIASYGGKLDWQSDYVVLEAMIKYETQPDLLAETDGVNILQYMEKLGFSIDPHVHTSNHADVAYLIEQLGVSAGSVIGGVEVFRCGDPLYAFSDWHTILDLEADGTIRGVKYPEAEWTPTILSGAAFPGHWYGDYTSGVWRPGNGDAFYTDQPDGQIAIIGSGYPYDEWMIGEVHTGGSLVASRDAEYVKELIQNIQSGEAPSGQMYTAAFQIRDEMVVRDEDEPLYVNENLALLLDELKPHVDAGEIVYVTFQEALQIWKDTYQSKPSQYVIENFSLYADIVANLQSHCRK